MQNPFLFLLLVLTPIFSYSQSDTFFEDYLQKWDNGIEYTLELAASMPEEWYDFKPTEEQMSFRQQLIHSMKNMLWISGDYLGGDSELRPSTEGADQLSKQELLSLLREAGRYAHQTVSANSMGNLNDPVQFFTDEVRNKGQLLMLMQDHLTHHRGQLIVYLRLKEIQPPRYRGW
jgi:uncharacterized damage-inducible protein DinB